MNFITLVLRLPKHCFKRLNINNITNESKEKDAFYSSTVIFNTDNQ